MFDNVATNGLRIRVTDSTRGRSATGMRVDVFVLGSGAHKLCSAMVNDDGVVEHPALAQSIVPAEYEIVFHVGSYFSRREDQPPGRPLLDTVPFRFNIADADGYRLAVRVAPWEFALER
jgi:5-hydroxyisourate hydrolase-like protein (transthyretin family)